MPTDQCDIPDWPPTQVFQAICADFETAWDAVAALPDTSGMGRGNFMFTNQAMILLEWACRLCANAPTARTALSKALASRRAAYFTGFSTSLREKVGDIYLPNPPNPLPSGHDVRLGGPNFAETLERLRREDDPGNHLAAVDKAGALGIVVKPAWLYMDFKAAIEQANILAMGLQPASLTRPDDRREYPALTADIVRKALQGAGHKTTAFGVSHEVVVPWANWTPPGTGFDSSVLGSTSGLVSLTPVLPDQDEQAPG